MSSLRLALYFPAGRMGREKHMLAHTPLLLHTSLDFYQLGCQPVRALLHPGPTGSSTLLASTPKLTSPISTAMRPNTFNMFQHVSTFYNSLNSCALCLHRSVSSPQRERAAERTARVTRTACGPSHSSVRFYVVSASLSWTMRR